MPSHNPTQSDPLHCAAIVRQHARTFHFASHFLPAHKRRAAFAVYAFCREADDLVDSARPEESEAVTHALAIRHALLRDALCGHPTDAVHRELDVARERFAIPAEPFDALLDALAADLAPTMYADWPALSMYCAGVASTVGIMCAHIFGLPADPDLRARALAHAQTLGVAMQLTNILRDVGEDARRGRCYLPLADLDACDIAPHEILHDAIRAPDPRWQRLMAMESARARRLFAAAAPGIALLDADAQTCATLCASGYAEILKALERVGFDSLRHRARVGTARKLLLTFHARRRPPAPLTTVLGAAARA